MPPHSGIVRTMFALVFLSTAALSAAQEERLVPTQVGTTGEQMSLNSVRFQAAIQSQTDLGTLARQHAALGGQATAFGFAARSEEARFFLLGSLYAETVAYVHSDDLKTAANRLTTLAQELINLQAPGALYNYVSKTQNMLERQRYSREVRQEFLTLLQPFLDEYAKSKGNDRLTLFQAGAWLVDMALTAAASDTIRLQQSIQAQHFSRELQRLNAPKGSIEALEQLRRIMEKPAITDADAKQALTLVKEIQAILA